MGRNTDVRYSAGTLDLRAIREEVGLSQSDFATLLGISPRTIQSCEQKWRTPSCALEKSALLLLIAHRNGRDFGTLKCWQTVHCPTDRRQGCVAYWSRQGHLCWFMTGTICKGVHLKTWPDKMVLCQECPFFEQLLNGKLPLVSDGH